MPRLMLSDIFDNARSYLDTDELNFPDPLLDMLMRRLWFQAVTMEREWRFFQRWGSVDIVVDEDNPPTHYVPLAFDTLVAATPATRIMGVLWNGDPLVWREASVLVRGATDSSGQPVYYSELNEGLQRNLYLAPAPGYSGTVRCEFYQEPQYPVLVPGQYDVLFSDLPEEFEPALQEGLIAEMYMREEDPDLYDVHRQMFLEQMGSIRNRWKESLFTPIVMAGRARSPAGSSAGFDDRGALRQPAAPG